MCKYLRGSALVVGDLGSLCINRVARADLPYDPVKDFAPLSTIATVSVIVSARKDLPATTFSEFLALAKARPGQLQCGAAGPGSIGHLALESIKGMPASMSCTCPTAAALWRWPTCSAAIST